jgi:NitT/TauT family transport system substrate-binding protein
MQSEAWIVAATAVICAMMLSAPAPAQTKLRVGQPQAGTFQFVPLQVAGEAGIFKRHGIDVDVISFGGGPRVQQALAAGSIDIGIGSGPELAFVAKGAPEIAIAAIADAPYSVVLAVLRVLRSGGQRISRAGPSAFPAKDR